MVSLLVGILMVVASAAGFGYALFGRRPVPQPAMRAATAPAGGAPAEPDPSYRPAAADLGGVLDGPWLRRLLAREDSADHEPAGDLGLSRWVRIRSAALLALTVVGLAALLGAVASIVVVGVVFLVG